MSVIPALSSHDTALVLALISTGSVIMLNSVVNANRPIPIHMRFGNILMRTIPAISTHCTILDAKLTTGTRADLSWSGP